MARSKGKLGALPGIPTSRESERRTRVDLAACYRLAEIYGMSKVIWNHITARIPDEPNSALAFRMGHRYDEVTASNLIKFSLDGELLSSVPEPVNLSAYVIHSGIYRARPEINCVMHTHTRAGQGVAALKEGLLPIAQESLLFFEATAYHEYEGISDDISESTRLARDLGSMYQMILRTHGLLTVGRTVAEAFWRMYQLDMACRVQMDVLATGRPFCLPPAELCRKVRQQYESDWAPGHYEWPALLRRLDKEQPDYAT